MDPTNILRDVSIVDFYGGKSILITGATGFMGKVLVEKLLRDCRDVKIIYILVRMKRGVDSIQRYQSYVKDVVFERVREVAPEQLLKIRLIKGDVSEENLDIDPEDEEELIESCNIIFHLAAKAKFSLSLREALKFNTLGTLRVLRLAEKMKNLIVFSHVSTSYCNPNERVFEERHHPAPDDPCAVIKLLNSSRESDLDEVESRLMKGYPNTYALSKIFAEDLVHSFKDKFPVVVTRPSVVSAAWMEPFPGYVESKKNGLAALLLARGRGVLRTIFGDPEGILEIIPVDIANNAILVLTCKQALMKSNQVLFSNLTNSGLQTWTNRRYFDFETQVCKKYPLDLLVWYPYSPVTANKFYYEFRRLLYHYIPAYWGDFWCKMAGEKPILVVHQRKFDIAMNTFGFYITRDYVFINNNLKNLPDEMNEKDRKTFFCDFKSIDMAQCAKNNVLGVRKYILNLDDESLELRQGLVTLFFHIDRFARLVFSIVLILLAAVFLLFIFDREYFCELFIDIYHSAKFVIDNNLVIRRDVIAKCNRS